MTLYSITVRFQETGEAHDVAALSPSEAAARESVSYGLERIGVEHVIETVEVIR